MLVAEIEATHESEVRSHAAELPEDCTVLRRDFVDGRCVTGGDEVVAVRELVDGVHMEVVPW